MGLANDYAAAYAICEKCNQIRRPDCKCEVNFLKAMVREMEVYVRSIAEHTCVAYIHGLVEYGYGYVNKIDIKAKQLINRPEIRAVVEGSESDLP